MKSRPGITYEAIVLRVEKRLDALGMNADAASKAAGMPDCIRNLKRSMKGEQKRRGVKLEMLEALAPILKTSAAWLAWGIGREDPSAHDDDRVYFKEWRRYRGLELDEAAGRMDLDAPVLESIENRVLPFDEDTLQRMGLAYGCERSDLLEINPLLPDKPKLVYSKLRDASPEMQTRALALVEALLKAG